MSANIYVRCPGKRPDGKPCNRLVPKEKVRCVCGQAIRSLKLKVWVIDLTGNDSPTGKRFRERVKGQSSNAMAAERRLRELLGEVADGPKPKEPKYGSQTVGSLIDWYLARDTTKGLKSYDTIRYQLAAIKDGMGKGTQIGALTPESVAEYQAKRKKAGRKPATVNKEIGTLVGAVNAAVKARLIPGNPIAGIEKLPENNARDFTIDVVQLDRLMIAARSLVPDADRWLVPMMEVGFFTLMRPGELRGLTWERVDLKRGTINLTAEETKTERPRLITLHERAKQALERIKPTWAKGSVFLRENGQEVRKNRFERLFRDSALAAGLIHPRFGILRPHDLRHSGATYYELQGSLPAAINSLGGWAPGSRVREQRYLTRQAQLLQKGLKG